MNQQRILIRTDRMTMRWGEMDALGHMNNVAYMRYFEEVRIAWFKSLELGYQAGSEGPLLGTITCRYLKPAIYPVEFEIVSYIGKPGNSSFSMWHELYNANDSTERYAEAESKLVWVDMGAGRSCPMPDWLRDMFHG